MVASRGLGEHQAGEFVPLLHAGAAVGAQGFSWAEGAGGSGELHAAPSTRLPVPEAGPATPRTPWP